MHKTVSNATKTLLTTVSLAALLTTGQFAAAQTPAGGNGRALDANQQVGSGGVNSDVGRVDFSRQNDVITGNVGGGRAFQDTIDYSGVGEFQDNLGSDTLYNFRRNSLQSSPTYFNAATLGGVNQQNNFRVFRSFTNRSAQPISPGLIAPQGGGYVINPSAANSSIYSTQLRASAFQGTAGNTMRQTIGIGTITGRSAASNEGLNRQLYEQAEQDAELISPYNISDSLKIQGSTFDPFGDRPSLTDGEAPALLRAGQLPPSMMIGQQLRTLIDPNNKNSVDAKRTQQVLDTVFDRLDDDKADDAETSVYEQLLRNIQEGTQDETDAGEQVVDLEAPTSEQLSEAERAYDGVMKQLYGEDYMSRLEENDTESEDSSVQDVIGQLNYNLPRLETLAANKQTRIADLTRDAETALASGKYLTAETRFRQLIQENKKDPMPRAGLVHAQLGAGMFRSAGSNLRNLFVQHPELIAARYDAKLLPPQDRLQWIQQELQSAISQGEGGKDAPLLLAYLGYQADSRQVVRYGLALAQTKSPHDPLLLVVREIWLDESDTSPSDQE